MKKLKLLIVLLCLFACDSENANDCFQKTGAIIQDEISVPAFNKILVNRDVELVLKEGDTPLVIVETGENLKNDILVEVIDEQLILTDNNTCNYARSYGTTKVYVTAPNITEIRSSTQYDISSDGVLNYPNLRLLSENYNKPNSFPVGDFKLHVASNSLNLVFNSLSNCFIDGTTNNLSIHFASGNGRFEGANLIAQNITVNHRGSNDMIINPQQSVKGKIVSTGDVILKTTPPVIEVETLYKGRVILD